MSLEVCPCVPPILMDHQILYCFRIRSSAIIWIQIDFNKKTKYSKCLQIFILLLLFLWIKFTHISYSALEKEIYGDLWDLRCSLLLLINLYLFLYPCTRFKYQTRLPFQADKYNLRGIITLIYLVMFCNSKSVLSRSIFPIIDRTRLSVHYILFIWSKTLLYRSTT